MSADGSPNGSAPTVKKQRSLKFSLYPNRSRPSSSKGTSKSSPTSTTSVTPDLPPMPTTSSVESFSSTARAVSQPGSSQRSSSNDSYRTGASPISQTRNLRHIPSEASRLRALNNGYSPQPVDGRPLHEVSQPENFSRPRKPSIRSSDDSQRLPLYTATTFPSHSQDEITLRSMSRDRGLSTSSSSSRSTSAFPAIALRPSMSIPDLNSNDASYSRQRNFTNSSTYQPRKGHTVDSYASHLREPHIRPNGFVSEEVRASFRSALTTSSSFLGTSGTERSSVMTKSSSATSIFGRDESFSVDDAIGMYENGFVDSGAEEGYGSRPDTSLSQRSDHVNLSDAKNDTLNIPGNIIMRDSNAFFEDPVDIQSLDGTSESILTPRAIAHGERTTTRTITQQSSMTFDDTRDRYGFRKKSQHVPLESWESWNGPYEEYITRRRKKWVAMMNDSGLPSDKPISFPPKSAKVKRFVRKGIPPDWRGAAWFWYAGGPAMVEKHPGLYQALLHQASTGGLSATDEELIERDLNRTFPDNIRFKPDPVLSPDVMDNGRGSNQTILMPETPLLQSLRKVLQAFAVYNPRIGYCQSLNFLAGLLLLFMDEEKSFWLLNIITRVYLPGTHEVNLEGANVDLGVLMTSVKESMPAIWAKIGGELDGSAGDGKVSMRLPPITLCCTAWFMSCFIGTLPIETTLRVWDSFFYEGSKTLFRIALAVFKVGETEIRAVSDPMEIFQVVQTIPRRLVDANGLLEACFKRRNGFGHLSQETIEMRRAERREGYAEERRAKAAGVAPMVGRKNTLFRRRAKLRPMEAP